MTRRTVPIAKVVAYWETAGEGVFSDLHAYAIGWDEPFCFRCGWLAPLPDLSDGNPWTVARSWLELAHLHNHAAGGADEPGNVVPLCALCHRAQPPSMAGRDQAVAWVNALTMADHDDWWQTATDFRWGGEAFRSYPGWDEFFAYSRHVQEVVRRNARVAVSA